MSQLKYTSIHELLQNYLEYSSFSSFKEYSFSLIFFSSFTYIFVLVNLFLIFFLFDLKYLKTLNDFKLISNIKSLSVYVIVCLMSIAGVPPLLGFSNKFLMFILFFFQSSWLFIFFFSVLNIFLIYFYIQNFRFSVAKKTYTNVLNVHIFSKKIIFNLIVIFNFFNLFTVLFFEDFLVMINSFCLYLFL